MSVLTGRTALITGGSEGIGFAIADAFARAGADLVLVARDAGKLAAAATGLRRHGVEVSTVAADLADPGAVAGHLGHLRADILVNNAGVTHLKTLADTTDADFDAMVRVNLGVPFQLTRLLLPSLTAAGGSVVNISSYWGRKMVEGRPASMYSATRGALDAFTKALASELGPAGVRVNAIVPGSVRTPAFEHRRAHGLRGVRPARLPDGPDRPAGRRRRGRALPGVPGEFVGDGHGPDRRRGLHRPLTDHGRFSSPGIR
ncbi:SDR family NAD(P)-dependent oxidoreductase [Amycolatopsis nalaikhensis]|uniref:SDR family NAD(P)-dependent oxidoreductase n=1 Tax=Amycolatopsis nalaikhensis TaxID=715472 RepID=UPI003DA0A832